MLILFVHGMGRTPRSGWPMLLLLRRAGHHTRTFSYRARAESFERIVERLTLRLAHPAEVGEDVIAIGHSLGGVVLRAAIARLPEHHRPRHVFLLGSPQQASMLAMRLSSNWLYRTLNGDCGLLLASQDRMDALPRAPASTTSIVGTAGWRHRLSVFKGQVNDGIVSLAEVRAEGLTDEIRIAQFHTLLPASPAVAKAILSRLASRPRGSQQT